MDNDPAMAQVLDLADELGECLKWMPFEKRVRAIRILFNVLEDNLNESGAATSHLGGGYQ